MWSALILAINSSITRSKKNRDASDEAIATGPSWRHRRKLIYGAYFVAIAMIVFGAVTFWTTSQVGVELVIGGVSLLAIIVTAYTTSATYEDVRLWNHQPRIGFGESEPDELDTNSTDGL
jgi:hypothetical protein